MWLQWQLRAWLSRRSYCRVEKVVQKQLVLLFLFSFTSSNCTSEKPCNNMNESFLTMLNICFEILMQIWAPGYSFFHDDLVFKTNAMLNTWFKELQQVTALIKQEHASVYLRVGIVSGTAWGFFVCGVAYTGVMLWLESQKEGFCGLQAHRATASMYTNRQGTCFCTHKRTYLCSCNKCFLKIVRHQQVILEGLQSFKPQIFRATHLPSTQQEKEQSSTYYAQRP